MNLFDKNSFFLVFLKSIYTIKLKKNAYELYLTWVELILEEKEMLALIKKETISLRNGPLKNLS